MSVIADLPDIRPSLLLDIVNSGRIHPLMQCTRASTATYIDRDGRMRTAANNVPRIDHGPATGECKGLLVEAARTNLSPNSSTFTGWTMGEASLDVSSVPAPKEGETFRLLKDTVAANVHGLREDISGLLAGTVYTRSFYVAYNGTTPRVQIQFTTSGGALLANVSRVYDLRTGAITGTQGDIVGAMMQRISDTAWRISLSVRTSAVGGMRTWLYLNGGSYDGTDSYAGDGVSGVLIWGTQFEEGSYASSLIPTAGTAATRAADAVWMDLPAYSSIAVLTEYMIGRKLSTARANGLYAMPSGDPRISVIAANLASNGSAGLVTSTGSSNQVLPLAPVAGRIDRVAFSYAVESGKLLIAARGSNLDGSTSALGSDMRRLCLGNSTANGTEFLDGYVRRVAIWLKALEQNELRKITEMTA